MQIYRLRSPLQCSESIYCSDTFDSFNDLVTAGHCIEWLIIFINDQKKRVFGTLVHILIKKYLYLHVFLLNQPCPALQCPRIFSGVMELTWGGLYTPWHVNQSKNLAPCTSPRTTQPTAVMASSYPPPFEGTGEVKEGFLCPLCLKDLQSFYQLQEHYEEEHSGDDRHVRGQLKSEFSYLSCGPCSQPQCHFSLIVF